MSRRADGSRADSQGQPLPARIANLLKYYIECVKQDEGLPIRVSQADLGVRCTPWPHSSDLWHMESAEATVPLHADQFRFADRIRQSARGGTLLYGYPLYCANDKSISPVFTWPVECELREGELVIYAIPEWPQLNPEYLSRLAQTPEERRAVLALLGLLDITDDPPDDAPSDLLSRMEKSGLLLNMLEPIHPETLSHSSWLSRDIPQGVINSAALFIGDGPRFGAGLVRDLEEMVRTGAPGWRQTALGALFDSPQRQPQEDESAVIEVTPLNEEQRQAVRQATHAPMTVVTGPPGTGKSQIVVSLIADAYLRGKRVLFTSKNNKAVDVVESRVSALASYPLMVRTGSRAGMRNLRTELAQRLTALLALRPSKVDHRRYEELKVHYKQLQSQQRALWDELQEIRQAQETLRQLDESQIRFSEEHTAAEWEGLTSSEDRPDLGHLNAAL